MIRNAKQMLHKVLSGVDLYNPHAEEYVFAYNDCGAICVYTVTEDYAEEYLVKKSEELNEPWSALLGPGGAIYEDEDSCPEHDLSALEFCEDAVRKDGWMTMEEYKASVAQPEPVEEWNFVITSEEWDPLVYKFTGTERQVKKRLLELVEEDKTEDPYAWVAGSEIMEDVEYLSACGCYEKYRIDYYAYRISELSVLPDSKEKETKSL